MNKKIILYISLIIIILALVFFSQREVSRSIGKNLISTATSQASAFLSKDTNLAMPNIFSKITEQV